MSLIDELGFWKALLIWMLMTVGLPGILMVIPMMTHNIYYLVFGGFVYTGILLWQILLKLFD